MKNQYIHKQITLVLAFLSIMLSVVKAQTQVTAPMTGTPAAGEYYSTTSIVLSPNFSFAASTGQSLRLFVLSSGCAPLTTTPSNQNYVMTSTPRITGFNPATSGYTSCDVMQTIAYFDGLGRPLQTVQVKGNPDAGKDLVQPFEYDAYGRETTKYLPYTTAAGASGSYRSDALAGSGGVYSTSAQKAFYGTSGQGYKDMATPFSLIIFEPSPLKRVTEQGAPGDAWQPAASRTTTGRTVVAEYSLDNNIAWATNASTSKQVVKYYATINTDFSRTLTNNSTYSDNELYVTITKDENWVSGRAGTVEEYKDKEGHVVLKRAYNLNGSTLEKLSTYYVYDDFGNLAFVLPPKTAPDNGLSSTVDQAILNSLCYQYQYDERQRMNGKHLPGKDWEYTLYNKLDQPVLTQDGIQRGKSPQEWLFTKYDALGRVIMTGLYKNTSALSRATLQDNIYSGPQFDVRNYAVTPAPYVLTSWPAPSWAFTVYYYDDYNYPGNPYDPQASGTLTNPHGQLTASRVAVMKPDGTYEAMLWTVIYYDDKGRQLEVNKQHYLGGTAGISTNNYDNTAYTYNFNDQVTRTVKHHYTSASTTAASVVVGTDYYYDHMGRAKETWNAIWNGTGVSPAPTLLSSLTYNELGQLQLKKLHNNTQSINYAYNERGWLSRINDPSLTQTTGQLFSEQLNYNTPQYGATAQYNGNIAEQSYQVYNSPTAGLQTVAYSYDPLNRLTSGVSSTGFSETGITYDAMGNFVSLTRSGTKSASLAYAYQGNQLTTVTNGGAGFRSYAYDANGNATSDGMGNTISYNLLNLPASIPGKNLTYAYDITGQKLRKIANGVATEYISGIQYTGTTIDFIQTEEGRAIKSGSNYVYEYTLADHLGNNRVTFDQTTGKVGEDDYYPFGLNVHRVQNAGNKYLYNKKEIQEELNDQYDYGARFYDPVVGRWTSVDLLAEHETQIDKSPYAYGWNNPVNLTDPDGNCPCFLIPFILEGAAIVAEAVGITAIMDVAVVGTSAIVLHSAMEGKSFRAFPSTVAPQDATRVNRPAIIKPQTIAQARPSAAPGSRSGKSFTPNEKKKVIDANKAKNDGKPVCENCGVETTKPQQSQKGVTPPREETNVDHIDPQSNGGSGTAENGQVLCRGCNLDKGATVPPKVPPTQQ